MAVGAVRPEAVPWPCQQARKALPAGSGTPCQQAREGRASRAAGHSQQFDAWHVPAWVAGGTNIVTNKATEGMS